MGQAVGHIFACTSKSQQECFDRMLFATSRIYGENVLKIKKGDLLFLLNLDTDTLYGTFRAKSAGAKDIVPEAWKGRYPYQVRVSQNGTVHSIAGAKKILSTIGVSNWHDALDSELAHFLSRYLKNPNNGNLKAAKKIIPGADADEKPRLESTTLWDYPRQSYGKTPKGDNKYAGVTPAFVIYNMVKRYTEPGDVVLDPMAGSGTTIDVCQEEGRRCIAFDISPTRPDIKQNDARKIPLADESVDMVFIDSPYGDNIDYNDQPANIGKLSAEEDEFYRALDMVMAECHRVMKPGKVLGWLIGDQWVKKKFTPVGFYVYDALCKYFDTVDIICVARRSQTSNTGIWHNRALRFNFYLRGFKYLFLMRKPAASGKNEERRKRISWTQYPRS
jgi:DNA modification methylase